LDRIVVSQGNGWDPPFEQEFFDCIHVGAAAEKLPQNLIKILKKGGKMVIPIGMTRSSQFFCRIQKNDDGTYDNTELFQVAYVPLVK